MGWGKFIVHLDDDNLHRLDDDYLDVVYDSVLINVIVCVHTAISVAKLKDVVRVRQLVDKEVTFLPSTVHRDFYSLQTALFQVSNCSSSVEALHGVHNGHNATMKVARSKTGLARK